MRATDAAEVMARMLGERGVALERVEDGSLFGPGSAALVAWECFKRLAGEVASDGVTFDGRIASVTADMLLYETRIGREMTMTDRVDANGPPLPGAFHLAFSRQFTLEEHGVYLERNELALGFEAPLAADAERLRGEQLWGEAGDDSGAAWADAVERSEPFKRLVEQGRVSRFRLDQGPV
jgi:hypothetical protein